MSHKYRIIQALWIAPFAILGACNQGTSVLPTDDAGPSGRVAGEVIVSGATTAILNTSLKPTTESVTGENGEDSRVGTSVDPQGTRSEFVEGEILVRPKSDADLKAFLDRYEGTIVSDNAVPEPPSSLGITLTDAQKKPSEFLVRVNMAKAELSKLPQNAAALGFNGTWEFSSREAIATFADVMDAMSAGFSVSRNHVAQGTQSFPFTALSTQERPSGATFTDAFGVSQYQNSGSFSNVTQAWEFVAAHGIARRTSVAIIDDGFLLNTNGTARGADSDLPANPIQYDFTQNDYIADGPGATPCGAGNPCFWHGTGAAGVATGIANNSLGSAGTGGFIADPMLLKVAASRSSSNRAIRTAVAWGADVVSMSWGYDADSVSSREYDRNNTPFSDAIDSGSRIVFVAAAGNGDAAGNGYDVGEPHFFHPCIEDHVICVGALADNTTNRIGYSNFGGGVDIFAPTNIPVMSMPASNDNNPAGAYAPRKFGGTSAATPFVAGVIAMMKAINPDLSNDQVATILEQTAHVGVAPVSRYIDAYAAVRKAAEGIPAVRDRFEIGAGGNDINPTDLGAAASYTQNNLNMQAPNDTDRFQFEVPGPSNMTIDVQYTQDIANINLLEIEAMGQCAAPIFISDQALAGKTHRWSYRVSGGTHRLALRGNDIAGYNLLINFASAAIAADSYEPNDTPAQARYLRSYKPAGNKQFGYLMIDPRFNISASIHTAGDVDYYIVRGARLTGAEKILLLGYPALRVVGNEAPITMQLFALNADNTPGALLTTVSSGSCAPKPLEIALQEDVYYMVRISGGTGNYALSNAIGGKARHIPDLVHDHVYEILHPGDPIERVIRRPEYFVFAADSGFNQLRVSGPAVHARILDVDGRIAAEGETLLGAAGERVNLTSLTRSALYALEVTPIVLDDSQPAMVLAWDASTPLAQSENLIVNGGAESADQNFATGWYVPRDGLSTATSMPYGGRRTPAIDSPGPVDRGLRLFTGGFEGTASGLRQDVRPSEGWRNAINAGAVQCRFAAFVGGTLNSTAATEAKVTFLDANYRVLSEVVLSPVTSLDREGQTGLLPREATADVPAGTWLMYVDMTMWGDENGDLAFADNLELTLTQLAP